MGSASLPLRFLIKSAGAELLRGKFIMPRITAVAPQFLVADVIKAAEAGRTAATSARRSTPICG